MEKAHSPLRLLAGRAPAHRARPPQEELLHRCQALAAQPPVDVFEQEALREFQAVFAEGAFVEEEAMFVGPRPKR